MSEAKSPDMAQMDAFEKNLQDELDRLQDCQKTSGVKSCFDCEKMLDCPTRKAYVSAVYQSMNKGQAGDFEF